MNQQRDIERLLDHWFSDGPTRSPDRVLDVVADRIERLPQRPAWRLDWRHLRMNTTFKLATAVAVVAIVAVVGYTLLPGGSSGVGGPGATPSPSATPIPMSSGAFSAGTYAFTVPFVAPALQIPKVIVTLPGGWEQSNGILGTGGTGSGTLVFWQVDEVYANPCQWNAPRIQPGPTVDGLAAALAAVPTRNATKPVDVTLGAYSGKYLEWSVPEDADFANCDKESGVGYFKSWTATDGGDRYQQGPGQVDRLWILDINGVRVVMDAHFSKDATAADQAELMQIANSVRFEP